MPLFGGISHGWKEVRRNLQVLATSMLSGSDQGIISALPPLVLTCRALQALPLPSRQLGAGCCKHEQTGFIEQGPYTAGL